jgi:hypothetical protein
MTTPVSPNSGSANFGTEVSLQTDITALMRFFAAKKFRYSRTSPPLLKDVPEGETILDATLFRIYTNVGGVLYYIGLTAA